MPLTPCQPSRPHGADWLAQPFQTGAKLYQAQQCNSAIRASLEDTLTRQAALMLELNRLSQMVAMPASPPPLAAGEPLGTTRRVFDNELVSCTRRCAEQAIAMPGHLTASSKL